MQLALFGAEFNPSKHGKVETADSANMTSFSGVNVSPRRIADIFSELHGAKSLFKAVDFITLLVSLLLSLRPGWPHYLELTFNSNNGASVVILVLELPNKTFIDVESLGQNPWVEAAENVVAFLAGPAIRVLLSLLLLRLELFLSWVTSQMEFLFSKYKLKPKEDQLRERYNQVEQ